MVAIKLAERIEIQFIALGRIVRDHKFSLAVTDVCFGAESEAERSFKSGNLIFFRICFPITTMADYAHDYTAGVLVRKYSVFLKESKSDGMPKPCIDDPSVPMQ